MGGWKEWEGRRCYIQNAIFEMRTNEDIEEIQFCLWFGWQYFVKKSKQKNYFHSSRTEIVVTYYNVVSQIVENEYIIVACNGNIFPAGNYLFKVNNRSIRLWCQICSKLILKTLERHQ